MVNSPALELATWLTEFLPDLGPLFGETKWSVHVAAEPSEPANVITLYDTTGQPTDTDERDIERPSVQVRVRSEAGEYNEAYGLHHKIKQALILNTVDAQTSKFQLISLISDFASIGRDDRGRHIGVSNYSCHRVAK